MKEPTNIAHKRHGHEDWCSEKLCKEFWGVELWRLTCWRCGFARIVSNEEFLKWQYCDTVLYD